MQVVVETVGVLLSKIGFNAANREVHQCQLSCGRVRFLPVDDDIVALSTVRFNKGLTLDKHTTRTATRIIDPSTVWREHLNEHPHHTARGVELTAPFALRTREL